MTYISPLETEHLGYSDAIADDTHKIEALPEEGSDLLFEVLKMFKKYTVQPSKHAYIALAVYVAYTHASSTFDFAPRLLLTSAEKRSGKTRTMEIVSTMSCSPLIASNASVAALFRSVGTDQPPTICLDEADTIFGTKIKAEQNEDLRGLLNAGFQRGTPVLRTVGPQHEVQAFEVFAPAVMAAIGRLPDTITDRAINIRLRRRKNTETVSQYRIRKDQPGLVELRHKLSEWITPNLGILAQAEPSTPLEDRAADVWEPLFAVADLAGGFWSKAVREAAVHLNAEANEVDAEQSKGMELLSDIRDVLKMVKGDFVESEQLVTLLRSKDESRWIEEDLKTRGLANHLGEYEIRSKRNSTGTKRGYVVAALQDVFSRYLPGDASEASDTSESGGD